MQKIIYGLIAIIAVVLAFKKSVILGVVVLVLLLGAGAMFIIGKARVLKANSLYNSGDPEAALAAYKDLVDRKKATIEQRIIYANMLLRQGHVDESMEQLNILLSVSKKGLGAENWCRAKLARSLTEYRMGEYDEALEEAKEVFFDNGYKTIDAYSILTYLLIVGYADPNVTVKLCEEAYDYDEDNRDIIDNLFVCYYRLGDYEQAEELADILTRDYPEFVEAYYHGAIMQARLGNADKAKEYIAHLKAECKYKYLTTVKPEEVDALEAALNDGSVIEYLDKLDADVKKKISENSSKIVIPATPNDSEADE